MQVVLKNKCQQWYPSLYLKTFFLNFCLRSGMFILIEQHTHAHTHKKNQETNQNTNCAYFTARFIN